MDDDNVIIGKHWTSILILQKLLIEIEALLDRKKNILEQLKPSHIENIQNEGELFVQIGRLFIRTTQKEISQNNEKRRHEHELDHNQLKNNRERLLLKIGNSINDLNDMMESDPLYCLKRAVARTVSLERRLGLDEGSRGQWLVHNSPTPALLQHGPTCGMVALVMVARSRGLEVTVDQVLDIGRRLGVTSRGEMFSADWMALLAREVMPKEATVRLEDASLLEDTPGLLRLLLGAGMVLVPYDCAANSAVCLAGGEKAHWGVVTGLLLPGPAPHTRYTQGTLGGLSSYHLVTETLLEEEETLARVKEGKVKLVVRQSKSLELELYDRFTNKFFSALINMIFF